MNTKLLKDFHTKTMQCLHKKVSIDISYLKYVF